MIPSLLLALALPAQAQELPAAMVGADPSEVEALRGEVSAPDRSRPPTVPAPVLMELPDWTEHTVGNGVIVRHVQVPGVRKVAVEVRRGVGCLAFDARADWSCQRSGWLMDQGTVEKTPAELEMALDALGADLWSDDVATWSHSLGIEVPRDDLAPTLALLGEVIRAPRFDKRDVNRDTAESKRYYLQYAPLSADALAHHALNNAWFAAGSLWDPRAVPEAIAPTPASLRAFHDRLNAEAPLEVLVVGDVTWEAVAPQIEALVAGLGASKPRAEVQTAPPLAASRILAVDLPHAKQAEIRLAMNAPGYGHADAPAFRVVNYAYGGAFLSRLNNNLREERGLTYGAGSSYDRGRAYSRFLASVSVAAENTQVAIEQFNVELDKIASGGATAEEIKGATLVPYWNETLLTASSAADFYAGRVNRGETMEMSRAWASAVESITPAQTAEVAGRWFAKDAPRLWVVVGPREVIEPQLTALGWKPEWIAPKDAILGTGW
jgi:zinc protease